MRWQTLPGILLLCVAACSGSGAEDTTVRPLGDPEAPSTTTAPTSTTAPPPTTAAPTTTTEPDAWAVPATPDAAYFERVLQTIEDAQAEAGRLVLEARDFTSQAEGLVRATNTGPYLDTVLASIPGLLQIEEGLLTFESPPRISEVLVLDQKTECALVVATISFDDVYSLEREPGQIVVLLRGQPSSAENPTGWTTYERRDSVDRGDLSCGST